MYLYTNTHTYTYNYASKTKFLVLEIEPTFQLATFIKQNTLGNLPVPHCAHPLHFANNELDETFRPSRADFPATGCPFKLRLPLREKNRFTGTRTWSSGEGQSVGGRLFSAHINSGILQPVPGTEREIDVDGRTDRDGPEGEEAEEAQQEDGGVSTRRFGVGFLVKSAGTDVVENKSYNVHLILVWIPFSKLT